MKAEYVQRGESIDYVNTSEKHIAAGDVVVLGSRIGVAGSEIAPQARGSVHTVGVFILPKTDPKAVFAVGDDAYYGVEGVTATVSDGSGVKVGWVVEPSLAGFAGVKVKI